jgi:hypothetical protein
VSVSLALSAMDAPNSVRGRISPVVHLLERSPNCYLNSVYGARASPYCCSNTFGAFFSAPLFRREYDATNPSLVRFSENTSSRSLGESVLLSVLRSSLRLNEGEA